jgi:hypothetical protein
MSLAHLRVILNTTRYSFNDLTVRVNSNHQNVLWNY